MDTRTIPTATDTQSDVAELLRTAAAWLRLAATMLADGDPTAARNMTRLGLYGAQDALTREDALSDGGAR